MQRNNDDKPSAGGSRPSGSSSASSQGGGSLSNAIKSPQIALPKGGGAIRNMGEKFAANPVTGTGSMSVPIATSPGRSGFGPQLSLSYDSGAGNGPFGFGWSLSIPAITRKTDKGLPRYLDGIESDVFILSGAEDLVPVFKKDANRNWKLDAEGKHIVDDIPQEGYIVRHYRPRIEGLFARIERWTNQVNGDIHWRSISKDNILTIYGKDENARISDPTDPRRIFSWLICETRDDKGNAVLYEYKPENGIGVDLSQAHERSRGSQNDPLRTANRYLKFIRYGNRTPFLDANGKRPRILSAADIQNAFWMFEVVFDYGEHDAKIPMPLDPGDWGYRQDAFSSYRSSFEVRTCRLCQRVLMFHHFPESGVGTNCLVRSTDFTYSYEQNPADAKNPIYSFLISVSQSGYKRQAGGGYLSKSLPPLEFHYTQPIIQDTVQNVYPKTLENLPAGVDGVTYQWTDLHGEGIPGVLTEQADGWFYKRNISPIRENCVEFAPIESVSLKPNLNLAGGQAQFMDLAGDGQPDLVVMDGPMPGLYEHDDAEGWQPFRPFTDRLHRDTRDPNLKFIDLDGDGHADILITENDAFVWHLSLAEEGFSPAQRVAQALDEEKGPRLVFTDGTQSIYLADLSGDGLTDLVRIRNGEVCYWPNLGYCHFGAKITMDQAPVFDNPEQFDHKQIRLADIDGTGTTDIIYLHRDGVRLYFNQSGNSWSAPQPLAVFPKVDDIVSIMAADLLGNSTACLVWSSPLPGDAGLQMRYVDLMGGQKPHLLIRTVNNLGAETKVSYASSVKFYLQDKYAGKPWITKLPFPVHVVERVETYDYISRNRFVTRYAYHHGYFDGEEREFRGFGMVEQWDTEAFAALSASDAFPVGNNIEASSHVSPVHTKTWFHTGAYLNRSHISDFFAGLLNANDAGEYYREPGLNDAEARDLLLPDTVLPAGLSADEEREACRALKGSMLRQEVYALDGTEKEAHPYTVAEQNFTIEPIQPRGHLRHAVFFTHARETLTYHYERNPADPRVQHALTLEVDGYGNVLKEAAIGYGRRQPDMTLPLPADRTKQTQTLITYTENQITNPIDDIALYPSDYRMPMSAETRTYELTGYAGTSNAGRFQHSDLIQPDPANAKRWIHRFDGEINYEDPIMNGRQRRLIEHIRTLYRSNDLATILALGSLESLELPGESYQLAFTPGLLHQVFQRNGQPLLPNPANVLGDRDTDGSGYLDLDGNGHWWISAGRVFFSPDAADTAAQELVYARKHFFLPQRYRDPFHTNAVSTESFVTYDKYDLLIQETRDPLDNRVTVDNIDYRVLQPDKISDPNRNRTEVAFDILGMVAGTAVMGKPVPALVEGDSLHGFMADLPELDILNHLANPLGNPHQILGTATTRFVYDLFAYQRTKTQPNPEPAVVSTLVRETHESELQPGQQTKIQHSFSYSDGFGREIQKKIQAEPEKINGVPGPPRWVGSGWIIYNNKGKPVRQYEPFFSATHLFEFGKEVGVSPILFYDPVERVIATLHPNHTYEKVVFDAWQQMTYDVNDTVALHGAQTGDPRTDPDISGYVGAYFATQPADLQSWYAQRKDGAMGAQEQTAAKKAAAHADTPTRAYFDTLGRPFLTLAHNRVECPNHYLDGTESVFSTRVELDIEGNQRSVRDAIIQNGDAEGRMVMQYAYDMLGNRIYQLSMEAGARWMLNDVSGKPIRAWDSRGHDFRTEYDALRRPLHQFVFGRDANQSDPRTLAGEILVEKTEYGESHAKTLELNLCTRVLKHYDNSGVITSMGLDPASNREEAYDFKGNLLRSTRQLVSDYKNLPDWQQNQVLEEDVFGSNTTYDALNRPIELTTPHTLAMQPNIIRPGYNEANLLERMEANLRSAKANGQPVWTAFVANIDYDAKGQRQRIDYGNGTHTKYTYDPLTFRLVHLLTTRNPVKFPDDCPQPPPAGWPGCQVQNLHYTYDPAGNITHIRDDAQQTVYFRNKRVEPSAEYTYDAIYRLIEATGREHLGQAGGAPVPYSHDDATHAGLLHPGDGNAMGRYIERYIYDAVGNFLEMQHRGSDPAHAGWTRQYTYNEPSLLENAKTSNRLSYTTVGNGNPIKEQYLHDAHGNMTRMPHLGGGSPAPNMNWDCKDQLRQTDLGGGGTAYYVYDATGQRVRKVWEKAGGLVEERLYLGGIEIYRKRNAAGGVLLERETLHVMDDKQRIALVETRTVDTAGNDLAPEQMIRYQYGNHLGSASLELDDGGQVISYEEYAPYGSSVYQAVRSQTDLPKRYRFTGKERDEESGLYYFGARYYAVYLGRWLNMDPIYLTDFNNSDRQAYGYTQGNPINAIDPDGRLVWFLVAAVVIAIVAEPQVVNAPAPGEPTFPRRSTTDIVLSGVGKGTMVVGGIGAVRSGAQLLRSEGLMKGGATLAREFAKGEVRNEVVQKTASAIDPTGTLGQVVGVLPNAGGGRKSGTASPVSKPPVERVGKPSGSGSGPKPPPRPSPLELPPRPQPPNPKMPGPTVDPSTGEPVGRFVVDPRGNTLIEPKGGNTTAYPPSTIDKSGNSQSPDTHTFYPNGSNYQRLNPSAPNPHGHGHLPGKPGQKQGPSIDPSGKVVPLKSKEAHWPIK